MLKYYDYAVTFAEIPDEICLYITITGCPNHCEGCNSPWLSEGTGTPLNWDSLSKIINDNKGFSCLVFGGGDNDPSEINKLAEKVKWLFPSIKTAWYSGKDTIPTEIRLKNFDFIKVGPYIASRGPLNNPHTNQKLYQVFPTKTCDWQGNPLWVLENITNKFWKNEDNRDNTSHSISIKDSYIPELRR